LFLSALFLGASAFAQIPGMMTTQISSAPEGTALGANETLSASGIALGNRVKMRGYIDFILKYDDEDHVGGGTSAKQNEQFTTAGDIDFLFDFSPVTAEAHVAYGSGVSDDDNTSIGMEQLFGRYSVNDVFNFSFGRQLTALGYEADEAPGLFAVSNAYVLGDGSSDISLINVQTRRNYVDGIRANFNNGQFGLTFGIHDGYWVEDHFDGDDIALDLAASVMIIPGLEARLGYAHQEIEAGTADTDISQFNMWLGYNPNDLTLAIEYDNYDILVNDDYWSMMLLASYQFTDWFAATLRYSHEDYETLGDSADADRFTFAFLFSVTDNFSLNVEYSTTSVDNGSGTALANQGDYNEFFIEGLISY
jgi:predicted porin